MIAPRLIALRSVKQLSQCELAIQLQTTELDVDKNVITRIEPQKRYVSDMEIRAFAAFFGVLYRFLLDGQVDEKKQIEMLASRKLDK